VGDYDISILLSHKGINLYTLKKTRLDVLVITFVVGHWSSEN